MIINPYFFEQPLLLDLYPNAATAYSVRKLRTAYTGNCIRVRRSSDNAEQNIGFVNNELDTTSLLSFVGAGNGFVTTWYDQSTNGFNVAQTTAARQPKIIDTGNLILENNKPTLSFIAQSLFILNKNLLNNISAYSIFNVSKSNSSLVSSKILCRIAFAGSTSRAVIDYGGATQFRYSLSGRRLSSDPFQTITSNTNNTNQVILTSIINHINTSSILYENTLQVAQNLSYQTSGNTQNLNSDLSIGASTGNLSSFNGNIQEVFIFEVDQSTNKTGIETNINSYFNIYP
jgi:hypothetical protein